jgi:hypothetical protein
MFSKLSAISFLFLIAWGGHAQNASNAPKPHLTDGNIKHIINTLPRMVPQLREAGITASPTYYIWPRDTELHAKGEVFLKQYGYDAIQLNALETFCKAWFCLNYDSLIHERRKILSSIEEHTTENPYITDYQKRINIRIMNKDLGHNKEQLMNNIAPSDIRQICIYRDKIKEVWETLKE